MISKTKIIAMYLPQYHCIPENDEFWGNGFTDWVTVKKAEPLFVGHDQPKVPLGNNYYDLSLKDNIVWQAKLAKQYGIDGFGIYHYWFNNDKNILTKPAEIILENKDINIDFFFAWDNNNWKRSWSNVDGNSWAPIQENKDNKGPKILIPYILGTEPDWKNHYKNLLPYFKDKRYIKKDGKPIFMVWGISDGIKRMAAYWDKLAKEDGFAGLCMIYKYDETGLIRRKSMIPDAELVFKYEPIFTAWNKLSIPERIVRKIRKVFNLKEGMKTYDYDKVWKEIIKDAKGRYSDKKIINGAFVSYDDTPRRGVERGKILLGSTPEKFKRYFSELLKITLQQGKPFIFITAWNEWGEGAYLEPDKTNEYGYLKALDEAIKQTTNEYGK